MAYWIHAKKYTIIIINNDDDVTWEYVLLSLPTRVIHNNMVFFFLISVKLRYHIHT